MDLHKKLSLVTGSTSGIGLSVAHALAKAGSNVIITGLGDAQTIAEIVGNIERNYGVKAEYVGADLQNVSEIKTLIAEVLRRHPEGIDILINNAGVLSFSLVEDTPDDCWDKVVAVNLSAPFRLIKGFLPGMKKKKWGRIVHTSSVTGLIGFQNASAYAATKHGIIGLNKTVALECAEYGITCNAICPSLVDTQRDEEIVFPHRKPDFYKPIHLENEYVAEVFMKRSAEQNSISIEEQKTRLEAGLLVKKLVLPEQVAELVLFIVASGASNQMTGGSYTLDGGYTAQ